MPFKEPERKRTYDKDRRRERYEADPDAARDQLRAWRRANPERAREHVRAEHERLRLEVLGHYGLACACCGETEVAFLTLEHIGGTGAEHRRHLGGTTSAYRDVRQRGFPEGYETLCRNCNWGRFVNGGVCPHRERMLRLVTG